MIHSYTIYTHTDANIFPSITHVAYIYTSGDLDPNPSALLFTSKSRDLAASGRSHLRIEEKRRKPRDTTIDVAESSEKQTLVSNWFHHVSCFMVQSPFPGVPGPPRGAPCLAHASAPTPGCHRFLPIFGGFLKCWGYPQIIQNSTI